MVLRKSVKQMMKTAKKVWKKMPDRWAVGGAATNLGAFALLNRKRRAEEEKSGPKKIRIVDMAPLALPQNRRKGRGVATLGGKYGPKRFKKNKSKYYKKVKSVSVFNSFSGVVEHSGTFTDANCVTIGHATHPMWQVCKTALASIYAQLFNRIHRPVQRWSDPHGQPNTWGVRIEYTDDNGVDRVSNVDFVTGENHFDFVSRLMTGLCSTFIQYPCCGGSINIMQFVTSAGLNLEGAVQLRGAMVTCVGKSSLKVQNRTAAAAGDDDSDLNNQPLSGRIFERNQGFIQFRDKQAQLKSDSSTGRVLEYAGNLAYLKEPMDNWVLEGSGSAVPIRIDPGKIKTSTVNKTLKIRLDKLFNEFSKISDQYGGIFANATIPNIFGKVRVMMLERVLDVGDIGILGAYEIDSKLYTKVNTRRVLINRHWEHVRSA